MIDQLAPRRPRPVIRRPDAATEAAQCAAEAERRAKIAEMKAKNDARRIELQIEREAEGKKALLELPAAEAALRAAEAASAAAIAAGDSLASIDAGRAKKAAKDEVGRLRAAIRDGGHDCVTADAKRRIAEIDALYPRR